MRETWRKIMALLEPKERRNFWLLLGLVLAMGVFNMVGVAAVLPFLSMLADPQQAAANPLAAGALSMVGGDTGTALTLLGIGAVAVYAVGIGVKAATSYATVRYGSRRRYAVSARLMRAYLGQDYPWILDRHTADIIKTVNAETMQVVNGGVVSLLNLISNAVICFFMVLLLLVLDWGMALVVGGLVGGCYALLYVFVQHRMAALGAERLSANKVRFRSVGDTFRSFKEIKVGGLERVALRRFHEPSLRIAEINVEAAMLQEMPRYAMEALTLAVMMGAVLWLVADSGGDLAAVLPVAGVYALAGTRLMPAVQQVYRGIGGLRMAGPVLDLVGGELARHERGLLPPTPQPLGLQRRIELRGARFAYPSGDRAALDGVDLAIDACTTVGIVGGTGAGKTTAVDLILGLLEPQSGALVVDGTPIDTPERRRAWRRSIGYVPQQINLLLDSVAGNIALGERPEDIDMARVEAAARLADLHRFVTEELPQGYATEIGEAGIRLSGGQRQRVGIARALYRDPDVLVLDEATAALDNLTERAVMDALANLAGKKTVIMIAHRLSTVRRCDEIFLFERGRVIAQGSYDSLMQESESFRAMALAPEAAGSDA